MKLAERRFVLVCVTCSIDTAGAQKCAGVGSAIKELKHSVKRCKI